MLARQESGPYAHERHARSLTEDGFTFIDSQSERSARATALEICGRADELEPRLSAISSLEVVGEFRIPVGSARERDFQALHFDFGMPLVPHGRRDLARYTALCVAPEARRTRAVTRLVDLTRLLAQRSWPHPETLVRRFAAYGKSHGAWETTQGYTEGILGRLIEAAHGGAPELPSVSATPNFLCGTEFADHTDETRFLARHGLDLASAETAIRLQPGQMLVFDNLRLAHGRLGRRAARELHQLVVGHRALGIAGQLQIRERILDAFRSPGGS